MSTQVKLQIMLKKIKKIKGQVEHMRLPNWCLSSDRACEFPPAGKLASSKL